MTESTNPALANGALPATLPATYTRLNNDEPTFISDDRKISNFAVPMIKTSIMKSLRDFDKATIGYSLIAAYPIVKLAIAIITGAAIAATPANIILLIVLVLWLAMAVRFIKDNREALKTKTVASKVLFNFAVFATAPVSLPALFIKGCVVKYLKDRQHRAQVKILATNEQTGAVTASSRTAAEKTVASMGNDEQEYVPFRG